MIVCVQLNDDVLEIDAADFLNGYIPINALEEIYERVDRIHTLMEELTQRDLLYTESTRLAHHILDHPTPA